MPSFGNASLFVFLLASVCASVGVCAGELPPVAASYDFAKDIKPLLEASCLGCHGPGKQKGSFRVDSREAILKGGDEGKAIVEQNSAKSPLIHYVARLVEERVVHVLGHQREHLLLRDGLAAHVDPQRHRDAVEGVHHRHGDLAIARRSRRRRS